MDSYAAFQFAATPAGRKVPVGDVLPRNANFQYAVMMWRAEFWDRPISGFPDLQAATATTFPLDALAKARASGGLTEIEPHVAPAAFWEALDLSAAPPVGLRLHLFGESHPVIEALERAEITTAVRAWLPEEVEIFPSDSRWYVRFRDDQPLMFLAADAVTIQRLVLMFPQNILQIPEDFVFAA